MSNTLKLKELIRSAEHYAANIEDLIQLLARHEALAEAFFEKYLSDEQCDAISSTVDMFMASRRDIETELSSGEKAELRVLIRASVKEPLVKAAPDSHLGGNRE